MEGGWQLDAASGRDGGEPGQCHGGGTGDGGGLVLVERRPAGPMKQATLASSSCKAPRSSIASARTSTPRLFVLEEKFVGHSSL